MPDHYAENQIDQNKKQWAESSYRFTEPVRYFKNNDPYHWEIDNIPIKQLEENILWLKDQIELGTDVSGITRSDFAELKPVATGSGRSVRVQKGNFIARINDAYQKGIQTLITTANAQVDPNDPVNRGYKFNLPTSVLKRIAGDVVGEALYFNGLYEHLQHHATNPTNSGLRWTTNAVTTISDIPKNRLAVWRQGETMTHDVEGLQEQAVAFTRRWGGAIRTSVVNMAEDLEISIPSFAATDYANKTGFSPAMRADLLFIYAHPVDAEQTTIALPDGQGPTVITEPRLGLLKGAGIVSLRGFGDFQGYDSNDENDEGFFDSTLFNANVTNNNAFFRETGAISDENFVQTVSPLADLTTEDAPFSDTSVNLPSPDDVMNLTPLFQEGLENSFALVGQSVLPIAYIISQKGKTNIEASDIIDIRPFFRTAELSYNERSGVAAANPPLSFANPAVGKTELNTGLVKAVRELKAYVDNATGAIGGALDDLGASTSALNIEQKYITKGIILGGTRYGVEGALLAQAGTFGTGGVAIYDDADAIDYLQRYHGLTGLQDMPKLPGWDLGGWTGQVGNEQGIIGAGSLRNDRINCAIRDATSEESAVFGPITGIDNTTISYISSVYDRIAKNGFLSTDTRPEVVYFLRKRLKVILPANVVDYDVVTSFRNCVPATGDGVVASYPMNKYSGICVEKQGVVGNTAEFTIYVVFHPPAATAYRDIGDNNSSNSQVTFDHRDIVANNNTFGQRAFFAPLNSKSTEEQRGRDIFSAFTVLPRAYDTESAFRSVSKNNNLRANNAKRGYNSTDSEYTYENVFQPEWKALAPYLVTYPTVEFSVIGHTQALPQNYIYDTDTTSSQPNIT